MIDTHAHVYPAEYLDLLERCGTDSSSTVVVVARNLRAGSNGTDIGAWLHMMDAASVQMQVLSASPQLPQLDRQADAAARMINDTYAALIARYPGRFLAYVATPLSHIDAAIEEAGRALDKLGFAGITLPLPLHLVSHRLSRRRANVHDATLGNYSLFRRASLLSLIV